LAIDIFAKMLKYSAIEGPTRMAEQHPSYVAPQCASSSLSTAPQKHSVDIQRPCMRAKVKGGKPLPDFPPCIFSIPCVGIQRALRNTD
jgi:hypothetical protein